MGRRWGARKKQKAEHRAAKKAQNDTEKRGRQEGFKPMPQGNRKMEVYYALQGLHDNKWNSTTGQLQPCTSSEEKEEERLKWKTAMMSILPASFRIGTDVDPSVREHLEQELDKFVGTEMKIQVDPHGGRRKPDAISEEGQDQDPSSQMLITKRIAPAKRIPFIPHAYQLSLDRRTIRRNERLQTFHDWLKAKTSAGFITRQETVSMIPPIVLGVEPHHAVLDMCAAPGSKTSQLLEIVSQPSTPGDLEPRGCVVANDADPKRAYMLVFQLRRINSASHLVTSCNGQFFPMLKTPQDKQEGLFDRVLADVPCSGDGTARKNPGVWWKWSVLGSYGLHPLQLSIALNGARLCKVGGYLCYSTCALNPVENEAVVAELLRATDGALELVEKRGDLEGLVARPGWSTWRVMCEQKSKREIKNQKKKNNDKMKQRRREWEAKQNGEAVEGSDDLEKDKDSEEQNDTACDDKMETSSVSEKEDCTKSNDCNDDDPFAWDEATLKSRAEKEDLVEYKSFEDVPENLRRRIRESCFPPTAQDAERFGLNKCIRCLPQDMDSGGFFVALLRKVAPMSARAKAEAARLAGELEDAADEPISKRAKVREDSPIVMAEKNAAVEDEKMSAVEMDAVETEDQSTESPLSPDPKMLAKNQQPSGLVRGKSGREIASESFMPIEDSLWEPLVEFYGLSEAFPREQYMVRVSSESKVLYFVGKPVKAFMDRGIQNRVAIVNTGLKGFERNSRDCAVRYRVTQEGIQFLVPHMTKRKVVANREDFVVCLGDGGIPIKSMTNELAASIRAFEQGSFVVILSGFEKNIFRKMILVMWRCRGDSVNCLVARVEKEGMMSKLKSLKEAEEAAPACSS